MLTDAIIQEGLRLDAERTQGEWFVDCDRPGPGAAVMHTNTIRRLAYPHTNIVGLPSCDGPKKQKERVSNLDFLAHAANNYAAALREVQRLRKALKDIKEVSNTATIRQMAHDALEAGNGIEVQDG